MKKYLMCMPLLAACCFALSCTKTTLEEESPKVINEERAVDESPQIDLGNVINFQIQEEGGGYYRFYYYYDNPEFANARYRMFITKIVSGANDLVLYHSEGHFKDSNGNTYFRFRYPDGGSSYIVDVIGETSNNKIAHGISEEHTKPVPTQSDRFKYRIDGSRLYFKYIDPNFQPDSYTIDITKVLNGNNDLTLHYDSGKCWFDKLGNYWIKLSTAVSPTFIIDFTVESVNGASIGERFTVTESHFSPSW